MYKFLIIFGIVAYVAYKVTAFFFKAGAASQQLRQMQEQQRKQTKPEPKDRNKKSPPGEYIDYEEVK